MKKQMLALGLVASLALGGVAMASGGTQSNPVISLQYLTGTYLNSLRTETVSTVAQGTQAIYTQAKARLDQLGQSHLGQQSGQDQGEWLSAGSFTSLNGKDGGVLTLDTGSGVMWVSGSASAKGTLVDVTAGKELSSGSQLTPGHRYLAAEQTTVTLSSQTAQCAVEGRYAWKDGSAVGDLPFTDVPEDSWYYDAVRYAVEENLFQGTSSTTFEPMMSMQRSMLTTVLYRMAGEPAVNYAPIFDDVPSGTWYSQGVIWAAQNDVVSGDGTGKFYPANSITRQEIAKILYNYAQSLGLDVSARGDLSGYSDSGAVASWAEDAMSWAVSQGILKGSDGKIMPGSNASRAEVATMLQRYQSWMDA